MTSPFCALAPCYDSLWDGTRSGRTQREAVWREFEHVFRPGDRVIDIGCGTGTDAIFLSTHGITVFGIDASAAMVATARNRGAEAQVCRIEDLSNLSGCYDGAISNFGALNCVADLPKFSRELALFIRPGGFVVLSLLSRFCWLETLKGISRLNWRLASRRWAGRAVWRGVPVHYPTSTEVANAFDSEFQLRRRRPIGCGDHQLYTMQRRPLC